MKLKTKFSKEGIFTGMCSFVLGIWMLIRYLKTGCIRYKGGWEYCGEYAFSHFPSIAAFLLMGIVLILAGMFTRKDQ